MTEFNIKTKDDVLNCEAVKGDKKLVLNIFGENSEIYKDTLSALLKMPEDAKKEVKELVFCPKYEKLPKKSVLQMARIEKLFNCNAKVVVNHSFQSDRAHGKGDVEWDLKSVVKANLEIEKVCEFIKKNNFSPFEAIAFIHDYVSTLARYNISKQEILWDNKDQFFVGGFMELPEIVCAGYATLMKEIVDNLNMEGLKCDRISIEFKNMKKNADDSHARCLITISDIKYGLYQTFYDDPTWDNDEKLTHKFAHFAMSNNCHNYTKNKSYDYDDPILGIYNKSKSHITYSEYNFFDTFDRSLNKVDQKMIETAYFNVLQAKHPKDNFEKTYNRLKKITEASFDEQQQREYDGYITSKEPKLTINEAKNIYTNNKQKTMKAELTL